MALDFVESIMSELNRNLAVGKRTLVEMEESGDYTYRTRDGSTIEIPMDQFQRIWDVCDDSERLRLRLPIYISTDTSAEYGAWKVEGRTEVSVVSKLLGKRPMREDFLRLYHPDFKDLKKLISDAHLVVFMP